MMRNYCILSLRRGGAASSSSVRQLCLASTMGNNRSRLSTRPMISSYSGGASLTHQSTSAAAFADLLDLIEVVSASAAGGRKAEDALVDPLALCIEQYGFMRVCVSGCAVEQGHSKGSWTQVTTLRVEHGVVSIGVGASLSDDSVDELKV